MSGKTSPKRAAGDLYERDFYSWTIQQAEILRAGRFTEMDVPNLVEEIETLGRSEAAALRSAYRLVLLHLLKMRFQPERTSRSWRSTIVRERGRIEEIIAENPGLAPRRGDLFAQAYGAARREAAAETGLDTEVFPKAAPFSIEQVEDHEFWPTA